jgi:hypothetical protein
MEEFEGRTLLVVTKHGKEKVLGPLMERELKVNYVVTDNFDTDQFGMFSGEKTRDDDPISTLRKKCKEALRISPFDLAIASEGSFGPHPYLPFAHANDELIMLIDQKNDFELLGRELNTETNFLGQQIDSEEQFMQFLKACTIPFSRNNIKRSSE